jgi:ubiquinone biosynthesis protein COQ4
MNMGISRKITEARVLMAIAKFSQSIEHADIDEIHFINRTLLKALTREETEKFTQIMFAYPGFKDLYEAPRAERHDLEQLALLPANTLGYQYAKFMSDTGFSIDWYPRLKETSPLHFAYNRQYDTHDILHAMTGFPGASVNELGLQGFYLSQTVPNPTAMSAFAAAALNRLKANDPDQNLLVFDYIFAGYQMGKQAEKVMFRNWEADFDTDIDQLRDQLGIVPYDNSLSPLS